MDSKPIAIIIAIVITIGAMGAVIVTGGNILSGTSASIDLLPKTVAVFSINEEHLEVNVQMTNQGLGTIHAVNATLEIDGLYTYNLIDNKIVNVAPYKTLVISGNAKGIAKVANLLPPATSIATSSADTTASGVWDIYPGESVLLRINANTTSGDIIEKLHEITVK